MAANMGLLFKLSSQTTKNPLLFLASGFNINYGIFHMFETLFPQSETSSTDTPETWRKGPGTVQLCGLPEVGHM